MTRNILALSGGFMGTLSLISTRNLLELSLFGCLYPVQGAGGRGVGGGTDVCWPKLSLSNVADTSLTTTEQPPITSEPRRFAFRLQVSVFSVEFLFMSQSIQRRGGEGEDPQNLTRAERRG